MLAKLFTSLVNLILACALVILTTNPGLHAQEVTGPEQLDIKLTGTAVIQRVGNLTVSPSVFDTGRLDIGQSTSQSVILKHTGGAGSDPISINGVELFGGNASDYHLDFSGYVTLNPGDEQTLTVTFLPQAPGDKNAGVRLEIGGASAPHIIMIKGAARYPLTSRLIGHKSTLAFGQVVLSKKSTQTLTLTNDSTEADAPAINLLSVALSGDTPDAFTHNFTPVTLAPGESTSITLHMASAQEGHKAAALAVHHDGVNNAVEVALSGDVVEPQAVPVNFSVSQLNGANIKRGTALQFGPDGKLYVAEMSGKILIYNIQRSGKDNYQATLVDTINNIQTMVNHNDTGEVNNNVKDRLVTGILVTGSAANPVIYTQSSDPRFGAGPSGTDTGLDTNSGILHKLTKNGNNWNKVDLVRGLPRSEENHQGNGMVMLNGKLLLAQGGHTNMGGPSNNFAMIAEYALSAAILEIDIAALGNNTYDLPTLDDEDQPGVNDNNDPFGGNNGKNQAILEANGPVKIYAPGFRNAYDLVLTQSGRLYTVDNGPNAGWGGEPLGNCTNDTSENGWTYRDALHYVKNRGYYGGHPNPTRGSKNNKFNASNPQSPIQGNANPVECQFKIPVDEDGALTIFPTSTNGFDEYTASNFGGAMQGDLVMASFGKTIYRVQLNANGTQVTSKSQLKNNIGSVPLDLIAQGDSEPFPGTIWIVDNSVNQITVLEPADY